MASLAPVPIHLRRRVVIPVHEAVRGLTSLLVRVLCRAESHRESSRWSRHSWFPSRTSSRGGSASPEGERRRSRSRLLSPSWQVDEDRQKEQSSLDFVSVVATLCSLIELLKAPSESHKIHGFRAALEDDNQPTSLYRLPVDGTLADILVDIDDRISSPSLGMHSKKASKLLQHPGVRSRCFYRFDGRGDESQGAESSYNGAGRFAFLGQPKQDGRHFVLLRSRGHGGSL